MKKSLILLTALVLISPQLTFAHEPVTRARTDINLPDIPGYLTLKCDFHIHTAFSDGLVWPSVRSEEAWREGLDAIAITDHIEYQPHKADLTTNHNRSFEIARELGNDLGVVMIKGSEITRSMPPGHMNAIFLTNSASLAVKDWRDSARIAHEQGAFIFWNHPGWERQLKDNKVVWYDEHTWLLEQGFLQGIEVVNGRDYYPEAHQWAIEKKLTMMSNSDIHQPLNLDYHVHDGDHRPVTLVFARERSVQGVKEALLARRTAVYSSNRLIGDEQFLRPIAENSLSYSTTNITLNGTKKLLLQIKNNSDLDYELERATELPDLNTPKSLVLPAHKTVLFEVSAKSKELAGTKELKPAYLVTNLLIGPNIPLTLRIPLNVDFTR